MVTLRARVSKHLVNSFTLCEMNNWKILSTLLNTEEGGGRQSSLRVVKQIMFTENDWNVQLNITFVLFIISLFDIHFLQSFFT